MKKVYFFQPNSLLGNSIYFPYAVGVIAAYSFQFEEISRNYELGGIVFKEDPLEDVLRQVKEPAVAAFSNYFWNYKYNLNVAAALKKAYPCCMIVFGGHQVSKNDSWLKDNPFIDILIFGEGEIPFYQLLTHFLNGDALDDIPNIAFRAADCAVTRTREQYIGVSDYPSPYTSGIFDHLLNVPEGLEFNAQLETNRGCPYHCSFCDWCSYDVPMRLFPMEKVKADLKWISDRKIVYCMCVDSNFGIHPRDEEIAYYAAELKKQTGYPDRFGACYAKDKTDRIFRINKALNAVGMSKGVSLAFQSMSEDVLKNVSRTNMNKEHLAQQLAMYHAEGIPTYTELILGLPGETYDSFCRGICELLELGQHDSINVFRCEVYPNSDLADEAYMKKYGIRTAINRMNQNHCKLTDAVFSGGLAYIVETNTMSFEDLERANLFSCCIQSLHCHGLMQFYAIYLHFMHQVSYYDFYTSFLDHFYKKEGLIGSTLRKMTHSMRNMAKGLVDFSYVDPSYGDISWPYEEAILLAFIGHIDLFYEELQPFLRGLIPDEAELTELMRYQKDMIVRPGENDVTERFSRNYGDWFVSIQDNRPINLESGDFAYRFTAQNIPDSWQDYARYIVWYGRRNKRTLRKTEKADV